MRYTPLWIGYEWGMSAYAKILLKTLGDCKECRIFVQT